MSDNLKDSSKHYMSPEDSVLQSMSEEFCLQTTLINMYTTSMKSFPLMYKVHRDDLVLMTTIRKMHLNLAVYMRESLARKNDSDFEKLSRKFTESIVEHFSKKLLKESGNRFLLYDHELIRNHIAVLEVIRK